MMEFDEIVVKESPGLCRCCLSEGCYKDLGTEYTWMNENEVYADMLLECFDISITQHNEGPNGPNRLICEVCITRLRDACNFKKQVLESEKKFIDMVARGEFRPKVLIYQTQMKAEEETNEVPAEDVEYLDEDIDFGEDESQKRVQTSNMSDSVTADPLPVKAKRGRPRKSADVKTVKKMKLVDEKPKTSKAVTKDKRGKDKRSHLSNGKARDKIEIRKFVSAVLELTTIMPFKWFHNRYMCFYCGMTFLDSSKLKEHTRTLHQDVKMKSVLKGIGSYSRIKWDISDLRCKVCPETMESLDEIANHAAKSHDLIINMDVIEKCCYVFRLSDDIMKCTECGETFKFFTPLLCHANKYHNRSKRYLCDLCGKGFAIKGTIISHIQNVHSVIANKCTLCCKTFPTRHSLTNHREIVHKVGKFNCPICSETFKSRYMKKCHLATVHDVKSYQFKCDMCGKVYPDRSKMLRHRSRTHLKEKTVTCHKCGHKAFDMSTLNRHMYSHEDIRPFLCELCEKTFRWKKNLITHMTRHHSL